MKLYLDTGNVNEIREAASYGLLDGVTTNPSLISKEGREFKDLLLEICKIVDGPISAECGGSDCLDRISHFLSGALRFLVPMRLWATRAGCRNKTHLAFCRQGPSVVAADYRTQSTALIRS